MSTETSPVSSTAPAEQQRSSRYLIGVGLLLAVLGLAAILAPYVTGIGLSILLGALLVVGGLAHVAHAFSARGWVGSLWQILLAVLYSLVGIALLANPVVGLTTLTLLVIYYFAISGVIEVILGVQMRPNEQWGWFVASGVISVILAGLLWVGFPSNAEWAIGLLVGLNFLSTGLTLAFVGYVGRGETTTGGDETTEGGLGSS